MRARVYVCVRGEATLQHNKKIPESRIPGKAYLPFPSLALSLSPLCVCMKRGNSSLSLSLLKVHTEQQQAKGTSLWEEEKNGGPFFYYYFCILLGA